MEIVLKIWNSLGWPHVALIFGVIFLILFKKEIKNLVSKIKKVGKEGVTIESNPEVQTDIKKEKSVQELMDLGDSPFILDAEGAFRRDFVEKGLEMSSDTAKVLLRFLTVTQMALDFEQIHNFIFGSQIFLLKKLNEVSGQGYHQAYMEAYFESTKKLFTTEF